MGEPWYLPHWWQCQHFPRISSFSFYGDCHGPHLTGEHTEIRQEEKKKLELLVRVHPTRKWPNQDLNPDPPQ